MKQSLKVNHRNTSLVLESEFSEALREIAAEIGESVQDVLRRIESDCDLKRQNFTSCVRVFVVEYYRDKLHSDRRN